MSFDYTSLKTGVAEKLIKEFGDSGYLLMPGESVGEDWESNLDNDVECPIQAVRTAFKTDNNQGTLVEKTDVMFLVSTEGVTQDPEMAQKIVVDCKEFQVVRIDPLRPGPVTMLWKVHARK
jgi:hypothetical protein